MLESAKGNERLSINKNHPHFDIIKVCILWGSERPLGRCKEMAEMLRVIRLLLFH